MGKAIAKVESWCRAKTMMPSICETKYLLISEEKVSTFIEEVKLKAEHAGYNLFCERLHYIGFKKETRDRKHERGINLEVIMPEKQKSSDDIKSLLMFPDEEAIPMN